MKVSTNQNRLYLIDNAIAGTMQNLPAQVPQHQFQRIESFGLQVYMLHLLFFNVTKTFMMEVPKKLYFCAKKFHFILYGCLMEQKKINKPIFYLTNLLLIRFKVI